MAEEQNLDFFRKKEGTAERLNDTRQEYTVAEEEVYHRTMFFQYLFLITVLASDIIITQFK